MLMYVQYTDQWFLRIIWFYKTGWNVLIQNWALLIKGQDRMSRNCLQDTTAQKVKMAALITHACWLNSFNIWRKWWWVIRLYLCHWFSLNRLLSDLFWSHRIFTFSNQRRFFCMTLPVSQMFSCEIIFIDWFFVCVWNYLCALISVSKIVCWACLPSVRGP